MIPIVMMMMMIRGTMTLTRPSSSFLGKVGKWASSGHEMIFTKYVPSKGPFFPNSGLTFFVL